MKSIFKTVFNSKTSQLSLVLLAVPILLHFLLLVGFSLNIPWIDDFYWYFEFLRKIEETKSSMDAFQVIITPYNNHWHILQRLLFVSIVNLLGSINMAYVVLVGNILFLTLFYFLFVRKVKSHFQITNGVVAAAWLFFQPVSHYNFFECAFFNLPVLLLSFLAIRGFSDKRNIGFFWGVLATFSNGNGLLIWLVGLLIAIWHRDLRRVFQSGLTFIGFALLYVFLSKGSQGPGKFSAEPIGDMAIYFVQMCGSLVNGLDLFNPWLQTICGLGLIIGILAMTRRALLTNEKLYFFMIFILMSMGIIALTRKEVNGFSAQIVNHYLMFPQLLLGCLVYFFIDNLNLRKSVKTFLLVSSIALSSLNYLVKLPDLNGHYALKIANLLNYEGQKKWRLYPLIQGNEEYRMVNRVTNIAVNNRYYIPPAFNKSFLSEPCSFKTTADGSIVLTAELKQRMLSRTIFIELTDRSNRKTYMPVDRYTSNLKDWFRVKKNRRIDETFFVNLLNEPLKSEDIIGCRILTVH